MPDEDKLLYFIARLPYLGDRQQHIAFALDSPGNDLALKSGVAFFIRKRLSDHRKLVPAEAVFGCVDYEDDGVFRLRSIACYCLHLRYPGHDFLVHFPTLLSFYEKNIVACST